jgi:hypothetical protein
MKLTIEIDIEDSPDPSADTWVNDPTALARLLSTTQYVDTVNYVTIIRTEHPLPPIDDNPILWGEE